MDETPSEVKKAKYEVSNPCGGEIAGPFTLFQAREKARKLSGDGRCTMFVTHEADYRPEFIYFDGWEYRPVEGE